MGCNCNGRNNGKTSSYVYKSPDGKTTTYRTEIEAQAARIRNGGGSYSVLTK